jgi:hypothetical protein
MKRKAELDGKAIIAILVAAAVVAVVYLYNEGQKNQSCPDDQCCPVHEVKRLAYANGSEFASAAPAGAHVGVVMQLPPELREKNWGGGSCVHATTVMQLRWFGLYELADWWRNTYSGGEYGTRLVSRLESAGLRYAYVENGDPAFIEWACRTRRGCGIFYKPSHSILCVGIDADYVYLLDNNDIHHPEREGTYEAVPRDEFFQRWKNQFGGFAFTFIYQPGPAPSVN